MPFSIQHLQVAQQQGGITGQVLADTVQDFHLASRLSEAQQAQFYRCCAHLVVSMMEASYPALLLKADVCFNHAYQLGIPFARGCPRHPAA